MIAHTLSWITVDHVWLLIGFVVYFSYSRRHSHLAKHLIHEIQAPRDESADGVQ